MFKQEEDREEIKPLLEWETLEFEATKRSTALTAGIIIGAVVLIVLLYLINSKSGMVLVLVATLFLLFVKQNPKKIHCVLYEEGIVLGEKVYHYEDIASFSSNPAGNISEINLYLTGKFSRMLQLPLQTSNLETISAELSRHIPEVEDNQNKIISGINRLFQ